MIPTIVPVLAASLQLAAGPAISGGAARPVLRAAYLGTEVIVVDGRLAEPVWRRAEMAAGFRQQQPDPGAPARRETEAWVAYDQSNLYVAMRLHDDPDSIAARLARRDAWGTADWAQVLIDSHHDRRTAFQFSVSPSGGRVDLLRLNDSEFDRSWDAVWQAAAAVDSGGWSVEMRIPLSQLRYGLEPAGEETSEPVWGISFWRWSQVRGELSSWAPLPADGARVVSLFGELRGLDRLRKAGKRLEVAPYASASITPDPGGRSGAGLDAGLDLRLGLGRAGSTLTLTGNPDFGQVEADPAVVNLTAFETFFPEKRPFFLEGADLFRFSMGLGTGPLRDERLFHSRRIGRSPQLPELAPGDWTTAPPRTRIVGAGKLSGKMNDWSYGVLDAWTARQTTAPGSPEARTAEPATNYLFGRAVRESREGFTTLGLAFTATHRDNDALTAAWLPRSAVVAATDAQHRFAEGDWRVVGYVAASLVSGDSSAIARLQRESTRYFQRPDATYVTYDATRRTLTGTAGDVRLEKQGGDWRGGIGAKWISPGYEMNDLGFQRLADLRLQFGWLGYHRTRPSRPFQRWSAEVSEWHWWNFGGQTVRGGARADLTATTTSFWELGLSINREVPRLAVDALRGGPAVLLPGRTELFLNAATDSRRSWIARIDGMLSKEDGTGATAFGLTPGLEFHVGEGFTAGGGLALLSAETPWQYVTSLPGTAPAYLVGDLMQTTVSLETRVDWVLTADASVQLYAQSFIASGRFSGFARDAAVRAPELRDRFRRLTAGELLYRQDTGGYQVSVDGGGPYTFADPDFVTGDNRATAVFRWEYRPGSTLFLVWSHDRPAASTVHRAGLDAARDALSMARPRNAFTIKVSYWLNP